MWRAILIFGAIVALVIGGLAHVSSVALSEEAARLRSTAEATHAGRLRLALWRLDGRLSGALAREDARPYAHYRPLHQPFPAFHRNGLVCTSEPVMILSPLLGVPLPSWLILHFQVDTQGWQSPQVPPEPLIAHLRSFESAVGINNVTPERAALLSAMAKAYPPVTFLELVAELTRVANEEEAYNLTAGQGYQNWMAQAAQSTQGYSNHSRTQNPLNPVTVPSQPAPQNRNSQNAQNFDPEQNARAGIAARSKNELRNTVDNEWYWGSLDESKTNPTPTNKANWPAARPARVGGMVPMWLNSGEHLIVARLVEVGQRRVAQGFVIDWQSLAPELLAEVADLFPEAKLVPMSNSINEADATVMTALPVRLEVVPLTGQPGWTPLRLGLVLAWAAAIVALTAVGLGGWTLIDFSERRVRFVSAVTHELRTPLTTLRLYLDMLSSGMVREDSQRSEYLNTLNAEADRLHRLISNVLDFARLERQSPRIELRSVDLQTFLENIREAWESPSSAAGKQLVIEPTELTACFDPVLMTQVVGNLLDNACKYSKGALDPRLTVRVRRYNPRWVVLEVEDHGPGITWAERRLIFRAFQRGRTVESSSGGVGLGLALASRWARLAGGRLNLRPGRTAGACFQVWLRTSCA